MSSSRFAHFNTINGDFNAGDESMDTQDGNNTNSTMTVTAGVRLQNPPNTGSFVTAVINGGDRPHYDKATVIKPASNGQNGQGEVITYNDLDKGIRENGQIGNVSFSNGGTRIMNGWFQRMLGNNSVTFSLIDPVKHFRITVFHHANSRRRPFEVTSTETVDQLKERITAEFGLSPEEQQLVFAGNNLAGGMTLQYYGIQEGSEISLTVRHFRITVFHHGNSQRRPFDVTITETVDQLKERITAEFGLSPEEQQLVFDRNNLAGGMTLQYYGIQEGSEISLTVRHFRISVFHHGNSRRRPFDVTITETVDQLKKRITAEFGLRPEEQQLVYGGKHLTGGMTLQHYGIGEGSEIFLTCRMRGG